MYFFCWNRILGKSQAIPYEEMRLPQTMQVINGIGSFNIIKLNISLSTHLLEREAENQNSANVDVLLVNP